MRRVYDVTKCPDTETWFVVNEFGDIVYICHTPAAAEYKRKMAQRRWNSRYNMEG